MISRNFIKNSIIYTLAGILPMASAVVLLPLYIENLSTEAYGALVVYTTFTLLIQIVVTFSFDSSVYIHYHELKGDSKKLSAFVGTAFLFMIIAGVAAAVILAFAGDMIFSLALSDKNVSFFPYGLASVGSGVFQAIFKVNSSLLQTREKPETYFWSNVFSFSVIAILIVIGLHFFPHSLAGPIFGRLAGSFIPCVWVLWRIAKEYGFHADFSWLRSSFSFNLYQFIYQLQQWVINQFDKILMLFYLTLADVGVYDFALKCLLPVELLMNSLHNAFYPKVVSALMGKPDQSTAGEINTYYHGLTSVVTLLVTGSILVVPLLIVAFVNKPGYQLAIQYIPYVGVIYFFRTMRLYFAIPYNTLKYTKPLPVVYIIVVIIKISLMLLTMSRWGIYGVISASIASAISEVYLLKFFIRDRFRYKFSAIKIVIAPTLLAGLIVIIEPLSRHAYGWIYHAFYVIISLLLLLWIYRNEIVKVVPLKLFR
ncbi:MAG: lipopolysaccharide biosynthesis protein [Chryseolinea sp.]